MDRFFTILGQNRKRFNWYTIPYIRGMPIGFGQPKIPMCPLIAAYWARTGKVISNKDFATEDICNFFKIKPLEALAIARGADRLNLIMRERLLNIIKVD